MKLRLLRAAAPAMIACLLFTACQKTDLQEDASQQALKASVKKGLDVRFEPSAATRKASVTLQKKMRELMAKQPENVKRYLLQTIKARKNAVTPTQCSNTPFFNAVDRYIDEFGPLEFDFYETYVAINFYATLLDTAKQYFGAKGQFTGNVVRYQNRLEAFWKTPRGVTIKGQHNSTLGDRDRIAEVYMVVVGYPEEIAYLIADDILLINEISDVFIETPLMSFDGFATTDKLIVVGDGLIKVLQEAGIAPAVSYAGIISHEWGHQLQFQKSMAWYGLPVFLWPYTPEFTRFVELEADFLAAYFMGSRKGIAFNWKRLAQFFDLFYNLGDCFFTSPSHHGTPLQRMATARVAYIISQVTGYLGITLTPTQIHNLFIVVSGYILEENMNLQTAMQMLSDNDVRTVFRSVLMRRMELKNIISGKMSKAAIENLP